MSEIERTTLLLWLDRCIGFDFHLSPMADLPPIVSSLSDYQRQTVIINPQCEVHTGLLTWCCISTLHLGTHLILIGYKKSVAVQVLTSYPRQFENSPRNTIRRENTIEWIKLNCTNLLFI